MFGSITGKGGGFIDFEDVVEAFSELVVLEVEVVEELEELIVQ